MFRISIYIRKIIFGILLAGFISADIYGYDNISDKLADELALSVAKITTTKLKNGEQIKRTGTGFLWKYPYWVVTSFHLVAGGYDSIKIHFSAAGRTFEGKNVKVIKVLEEADLVLLKINEYDDRLLPLTRISEEDDRELAVIGYPMDMAESHCSCLDVSVGGQKPLSSFLNSELRRQLENNRTLVEFDIDINIIPFDEGLYPGDSGAPVFKSAGKLAGIGHGGYYIRGADFCWCIPAEYLSKLLARPDIGYAYYGEGCPDNWYGWYGWDHEIYKEKTDEAVKNGKLNPVGIIRTLPLLVLSANYYLPISDPDFRMDATLFFKLYPNPIMYLDDFYDRFYIGVIANLNIARDTESISLPSGSLTYSDPVTKYASSFGLEGHVYLVKKVLSVGVSASGTLYEDNFTTADLRLKLVWDWFSSRYIKSGLEVNLVYANHRTTLYTFDLFGDAAEEHQDRYMFSLLFGLNIGYNEILEQEEK